MYIGDNKISTLRSFLNGYQTASDIHQIQQENVFPQFWYFHEWAMHKYNWYESTAGWTNIILKENDNDEKKSLDVFFELFEEFKMLTPKTIETLEITNTNIKFHKSADCKTKFGDGKPIYENPEELYLIEFSQDFGYCYFVKDHNRIVGFGWRNRFKNREDAVKHISDLFGEELLWQFIEGDLNKFIVSIMNTKAVNK